MNTLPTKKKKICIRLYSLGEMISSPWANGGLDGKASARNAGDLGLIPGLERSPGEGNGNPLQYSCLENPMGRGAWQSMGLHRV